MCGDDDPTPNLNDDDVSKAQGNALYDGIPASDGQDRVQVGGANVLPAGTENFNGMTFQEVNTEFANADEWVVQTAVDEAWRAIGTALQQGADQFRDEVNSLLARNDWAGETIRAAAENAKASVADPLYTSVAAKRGAELAHKFRDTMQYVYSRLVPDVTGGGMGTLRERFRWDMDNVEMNGTTQQEIQNHYDSYMRTVMNDSYVPGLTAIADNYPVFGQATAAKPGDAPQLPGTSIGPGSGSPGGGPGGSGSGGGVPAFNSPAKPELAQEWASGLPTNQGQNAGQDGLTDAASAAGDALGQGAGTAGDALGSATDAAGKAADTAGQAASSLAGLGAGKPALPEGMLNLGNRPPDLARGLAEGAKAGRGGGGSGGGATGGLARELASRAPTTPATSTSATSGAQTGASRAGISSGATGGAGAPAAGARGAGGDGKEHKASKALRSRKNGSDVVGETEAVLPVIGEESAAEPPATARNT